MPLGEDNYTVLDTQAGRPGGFKKAAKRLGADSDGKDILAERVVPLIDGEPRSFPAR